MSTGDFVQDPFASVLQGGPVQEKGGNLRDHDGRKSGPGVNATEHYDGDFGLGSLRGAMAGGSKTPVMSGSGVVGGMSGSGTIGGGGPSMAGSGTVGGLNKPLPVPKGGRPR